MIWTTREAPQRWYLYQLGMRQLFRIILQYVVVIVMLKSPTLFAALTVGHVAAEFHHNTAGLSNSLECAPTLYIVAPPLNHYNHRQSAHFAVGISFMLQQEPRLIAELNCSPALLWSWAY